MATSNIKLFDENKGNMMGDTEYSTNTQRLNGVQQGIASSQLNNKFSYQTSLVAYALAQIMMQNGFNANDSDAVTTFVSNMSSTLLQKVTDKANQSMAEAGTDDSHFMTPLQVKYAIDSIVGAELTPSGIQKLNYRIGDTIHSYAGKLGDNWLPMDGREIDQSTYPALYNLIGSNLFMDIQQSNDSVFYNNQVTTAQYANFVYGNGYYCLLCQNKTTPSQPMIAYKTNLGQETSLITITNFTLAQGFTNIVFDGENFITFAQGTGTTWGYYIIKFSTPTATPTIIQITDGTAFTSMSISNVKIALDPESNNLIMHGFFKNSALYRIVLIDKNTATVQTIYSTESMNSSSGFDFVYADNGIYKYVFTFNYRTASSEPFITYVYAGNTLTQNGLKYVARAGANFQHITYNKTTKRYYSVGLSTVDNSYALISTGDFINIKVEAIMPGSGFGSIDCVENDAYIYFILSYSGAQNFSSLFDGALRAQGNNILCAFDTTSRTLYTSNQNIPYTKAKFITNGIIVFYDMSVYNNFLYSNPIKNLIPYGGYIKALPDPDSDA